MSSACPVIVLPRSLLRQSSVSDDVQSMSPLQSRAQSPSHSLTLTLPDGRELGYAEYGAPAGAPVLYFHGCPSSCLEAALWHEAAARAGARLVAVDRPGLGRSTAQPRRTLLAWPADIARLARHLGLPEYRILAVSGGALYALACARSLPRPELRAVAVAAGMGPHALGTAGMSPAQKLAFFAVDYLPWLVRPFLDCTFVRPAHNPDPRVFANMVRQGFSATTGPDREVVRDERIVTGLINALRESVRQGGAGYALESRLLARPWGFELEDVPLERIALWYGDQDASCPADMGREMARRLKNADIRVFEGEGHLGVLFNHAQEILEDLLRRG